MLVFDCAVGFGVVLLCVCGLLLADYVCLVGSVVVVVWLVGGYLVVVCFLQLGCLLYIVLVYGIVVCFCLWCGCFFSFVNSVG